MAAKAKTVAPVVSKPTDNIVDLFHSAVDGEYKTCTQILEEMGKRAHTASRQWLLDRMRPFVASGEIEVKQIEIKRIDNVRSMAAGYRRKAVK